MSPFSIGTAEASEKLKVFGTPFFADSLFTRKFVIDPSIVI